MNLPIRAVTQQQLLTAEPGFYQIKNRDKIDRLTGTIKEHGEVQRTSGGWHEADRIHVARVFAAGAPSRDFIGYDDLCVLTRPDDCVVVDGWIRVDRIELEAGLLAEVLIEA